MNAKIKSDKQSIFFLLCLSENAPPNMPNKIKGSVWLITIIDNFQDELLVKSIVNQINCKENRTKQLRLKKLPVNK